MDGLLQRDEFAEAFEDMDAAIELEPQNPYNYVTRGRIYKEAGRWDTATADFSRAIELDANCLPALKYRGQTYMGVGKWEEARRDIDRALELAPEDEDAQTSRATIYRQLEQLVHDGQMRKYMIDSGSAACFEYIGAAHGHARFIHCKCEKCGKILHIDRSEIEEMTRALEASSGFRMDNVQTVLYGICGDCREP